MPITKPMSLLFHPKKNAKKDSASSSPPARKVLPNAARKVPPKPAKDDDEEFKLPDGPYQEFKLVSSALNGWKYDVMKFDARKTVDISSWQTPVKLNRKDLRREDPNSGPSRAVKPMLGPDGNQVFGSDGKPIMVDIEGRIVTEGVDNGKGKALANGKKKFQKKTRQVFIVPEQVRQLRREERYPWVLEDASGSETWIGQLEDLEKSTTHAFFMPAANDIFKFVPAHRWYKFQKKLKHDMPTDTLSVESAYTMSQKRDPHTWLSQRNGKGPSDATTAMFKAESEGRVLSGSSSLVYDVRASSGGRKLKAVDSGMNLFGEDDEDDEAKRRKQREYGGEGDLDENAYEEDFADDEEQMNVDDNDEEAKELEERLKKEYKTANKTREGYIDESDDEDTPGKTKQEKAMQKLILKREGNDAYDSDEEKNPYASSEEEEEEEVPPPPPPPPPAPAQPSPQVAVEETKPVINTTPQTPQQSRASSPVSPTMGGHSVVAKRATSPKAPKQKPVNISRGSSPLAGNPPVSSSRATSPVAGSRATSPVPNSVPNGAQKKRKADDPAPNGGAAPKPKKRKAVGPLPQGQLEPRLLIEWLRKTPNASTRDCITYFSPYLTEEGTKARFTALVKEVAQLKEGILVLRKDYREPSMTPASPPA